MKITDLPSEKDTKESIRSDEEFIDAKSFQAWVNESENRFNVINRKLETLTERTDSFIDNFKSFSDLKKEFKAILSFNGYSKLLGTTNALKKLLRLFVIVSLFAACSYFISSNTVEYNRSGVVTEIKNQENETLVFPAVTFCVQTLKQSVDSHGFPYNRRVIPSNLTDVLLVCTYEKRMCSLSDFEYFQVYYAAYAFNFEMNCYRFNGQRNASNHETELRISAQFGEYSGLRVVFVLPEPQQSLSYFVGDNRIQPLYTEIKNLVQPGKNVYVEFKKKVDIKLPEPFSRCKANINSRTSHLVEQILAQKITYRQKNCYELCLLEYASANNISKNDAFIGISFDYPGNCSQLCPLECDQVTFETSANYFHYDENVNKGFLFMNFFYADKIYTEIIQSEKITSADWVANNGGVLGLFLELSFFSVYRFLSNLFDILL